MTKVVKRIGTLALQGTASPLTAANRLLDLGIGGLPDLPPIAEDLIPDPGAIPEAPELPSLPSPAVQPGAAPRSPLRVGAGTQTGPTPEQRARRATGRLRAQGGGRRRQTLLTGTLGVPDGGQLSTLLGG